MLGSCVRSVIVVASLHGLCSLTPAVAQSVIKVGSELQVNVFTSENQDRPAAAMNASGQFVVVWMSYQDGSESGIFGRRFASSGAAQGSEFQVNSYTTGDQREPAVAIDQDGAFVVVWQSYSQDNSAHGVFGQRFDAGGARAGAEFLSR